MKTRNAMYTPRRTRRNRRNHSGAALLTSLVLVCALAVGGVVALRSGATATAENTTLPAVAPVQDTSPAIYVAEKNENSVVGIITNSSEWNRRSGESETTVAEGSGVVIAEGGYVLTNFHVIEGGNSYQVLMPDGSKVSASVAGSDSSMDLAVLKVNEKAETLVPVSIGSSLDLKIGSTVIAIGNPGGEILANTVTQGIVSALERSSVSSDNTTRNINYIQHDASINSGNSGGGLFDFQGNLVGINTLKYAGSYYSSSSYEGLGFAIPVETAYPIAQQLIENGKVVRPQMGITVSDYDGPDEATDSRGPASAVVMSVNDNSPAAKAGMQQYDFIYAVDGERVTSIRELTTKLDQYKAGDTVKVTVVRYNNAQMVNNNNYYGSNGGNGSYGYGNWPFGFGFGDFFGNYGGNYGYGYGYGNDNNNNGNDNSNYYSNSNNGTLSVGGGYQTIELEVTLEVLNQQ